MRLDKNNENSKSQRQSALRASPRNRNEAENYQRQRLEKVPNEKGKLQRNSNVLNNGKWDHKDGMSQSLMIFVPIDHFSHKW
jgi:hypothetical protein